MTLDGWTTPVSSVAHYIGSQNVQEPQEAATLTRCFQCVVATSAKRPEAYLNLSTFLNLFSLFPKLHKVLSFSYNLY